MLQQTAFPEISFWESNCSADVWEMLLPNKDQHEEWEYIMSHLTSLKRGSCSWHVSLAKAIGISLWCGSVESFLQNKYLYALCRCTHYRNQNRLGQLLVLPAVELKVFSRLPPHLSMQTASQTKNFFKC